MKTKTFKQRLEEIEKEVEALKRERMRTIPPQPYIPPYEPSYYPPQGRRCWRCGTWVTGYNHYC